MCFRDTMKCVRILRMLMDAIPEWFALLGLLWFTRAFEVDEQQI